MKCPTCRRSATDTNPTCARCGTDLATLQRLAQLHQAEIRRGTERLRCQELDAAAAAFRHAREIRRDHESARGLALVNACAGDFRNALLWYFRARRSRN